MTESPESNTPEQENQASLDFVATLKGSLITELPKDLYIPPDALEIFLEAFEGPLDLLLYLIKKDNLDITEISISAITHQYMDYIALMGALRFELAAEYLVMAATLAEIKSRMLLPKPAVVMDDEEDPTANLIRRLQEYERFKQAAEDIDELPRLYRDVFPVQAEIPPMETKQLLPETDLKALLRALNDVLQRAEMFSKHQIKREPLSVRERMTIVLDKINSEDFMSFERLFDPQEGKAGVVVTFLACLELLKGALIELVQTELLGPIHVRALSQ